MPGKTVAAALKNKATDALLISDRGLLRLMLKLESGVNAVASLYRRDQSRVVKALNESAHTGEAIYDGDTVTGTPIVPGTFVLTATGVPTLYDRDADGILRLHGRSEGDVLASGVNGATSVPATKQLTSAGASFITAGVKAGDKLTINDKEDAGVYTIVTVAATVLTVSAAFPHGSLSNCSYTVYASDLNCGTIDYFTGYLSLAYPTSPSSLLPATHGTVMGTGTFPLRLAPADTLLVDVDSAGAPSTATFDAAAAVLQGTAGTFASSAGSSLVLKIDNGPNQSLSFTASEDTITKYIDKINDQLEDAYAIGDNYALSSMCGYLNDLLAKYNAHMASTTYHDIADSNTAAGNAVDLASAITLANSIRTNYRAHLVAASEVEEAITLANDVATEYTDHIAYLTSHMIADVAAGSTLNPALIPCTDYATAVLLATDIKSKYNFHRSSAGVHVNNDAGNEVTAVTPVTTVAQLKALLNDIRTKYTAHCAATATEAECVTLVNELYDDYEAHRIALAYHSAADAVNVVNPLLYPCTTLASAILLANDIRTCYLAHRAQAGVHVNNDVGNNIASGACIDIATLVTLANQAKVALNGHNAAASEVEEAITLLNDLATQYEAHRVDLTGAPAIHGAADNTDVLTATVPCTDFATACTLANDIKDKYNAHRVLLGGVHATADVTNAVTSLNATNHATLKLLANDLRIAYEAHRVLVGAGPCHGSADATNVVTAPTVGTAGIHKTDDVTDVVTSPNAASASIHYLLDLANPITAVAVGTAAIHMTDDAVNDITAPAAGAGDLTALQTLVADLYTKYPLHIASTTYHKVADVADVTTVQPHIINLVSNKKGSASRVQLVSGTADLLTKLGFTPATAAGSGDAADITAVLFTEYKALVEADVASTLCTLDESGHPRLSSASANTGASSGIQVTGGSARTKFGFDALVHLGSAEGPEIPVVAAYQQGTLLSGQCVLSCVNAGELLVRFAANANSKIEMNVLDS